jgi:hypothetical protein
MFLLIIYNKSIFRLLKVTYCFIQIKKEFELYRDKVLTKNLKSLDAPVEISTNVVSSDNTEIEDRDWIYNALLFNLNSL